MKIAVTFENGEVFQHFGHTEHFKLYEIEAGQVVSSEIIDTNGSGHEALAGFLADLSVNVLLCGGIGMEIRKQVSKQFPPETYWTPIEAEELKRTYDAIVQEAGVEVLFFTTLAE